MKGAEWGRFQKEKDVYVFHVLLRLHEPFALCIAWSTPLCWAALNCSLLRLACAGPILRLSAPSGRPLGCTSTRSKMISVSGCSRRGIAVCNRSIAGKRVSVPICIPPITLNPHLSRFRFLDHQGVSLLTPILFHN